MFYHGFHLFPCLNSPPKVILSMILDNWGLQDKKKYFPPLSCILDQILYHCNTKAKSNLSLRQISEYICIQSLFSSVYLPEDRDTKERSQDYSGRSCAGKPKCCLQRPWHIQMTFFHSYPLDYDKLDVILFFIEMVLKLLNLK